MNRNLVLAIVFAGLAVGLYLFSRSSDSSSGPEKSEGNATPTSEDETETARAIDDSARSSPKLPSTSSAQETETPVDDETLVRTDGRMVRDHRDAPGVFDPDAVLHAPTQVARVKPATLVAVRKAVRPTVRECMKAYEKEAEPTAKAHASLNVSIESGKLTVDELDIQISGVPDEDGLRACLTDRILGFQTQVEGEGDVKNYPMSFPYTISRP